MQRKDIIQFWGADGLKRWSEADLRDVLIPASSKSFLMEVGLPSQEDWTLSFGPQTGGLPRLSNKEGYRVIGSDVDVPICLDEQHHGRVVAVEDEVGGSERLINSNVECFVECLAYYKQYRTAVRHASEDEVQAIIDATESQIGRTDPAAFDGSNNWWPIIIDQMNEGQL